MPLTEIIDLDGLTVAAARPTGGARPPLLLIHGLLAGAWVFERYQEFFADRGYPSFAVNLRGHCGSRAVADFGRVSMTEYVDDALEVAHWVRAQTSSPPVVMGHSMGGLVAQKVAEAGEALALVLLCAAPPKGISVASPLLVRKQIKYVLPMLLSRPLSGSREESDALIFNRVPDAARQALHERFGPGSGRAARELSLGAVAVDASKVRCPVLSVSAAEDRFVVPRVGRALAERYHAGYRVYAGHAHFLPLEPGWETPAADIERWLAQVLRRAAEPDLGEELWRTLQAHIGDVGELRFFDGQVIRAEIVNVDLATHADVTYEVVEERNPGGPGAGIPRPGECVSTPLADVTDFRPVPS